MQGYRAIKIIGEGSFGEVWLGQNPRGEKIALKYLRLDRNSQGYAAALALFKREFELLCELKHAHLARVLDFGFDVERGQYFLVTEFCEGKKISDISPDKTLEWWGSALRQVLAALDYIHNRGVVHLDIKPENVLVAETGQGPLAKLIDFGVATRLSQNGGQGIGGSPAYMAPELLGEKPDPGPRADLYSLGMLCLEALAGRLPFDLGSRKSALEWHQRGSIPPSFWSESRFEIPKYLQELVENLLAKDPKHRFSNARAVLNFLDLAAGEQGSESDSGFKQHLPHEGPLVGRQDLLEKIHRAMDDTLVSGRSTSGQVIFLTGETGIGKSRILQEARHFAALREISTFELSCDWEISPWTQLSEALDLPPLAQDNPSADWQLLRKVDALRELGKERPFCLLIDDLHKAGPEFRSVFLKLAENGGLPADASRYLVLAATQEEIAQTRPLPRLDAKAVGDYAEQILGRSERSAALGKALWEYSGGLPLLMSEGLRFLAPRFRGDEALEELRIPGLSGIFEQRYRALTESEREILELCAAIFRPVPEADLAACLGISEQALRERTLSLLEAGLIKRQEGREGRDVYQSGSQALAVEILDLLPEERRRDLHGRIAAAMEIRPGCSGEEMGYHLGKSGRFREAVEKYRAASASLQARGELAGASRNLDKALNLLAPGQEAWRELQWESARLGILTGNFAAAEQRLLSLPAPEDWKTQQLLGWLYFKKRDFDKARGHYTLSLEALPPDLGVERLVTENALGNIELQTGKYAEAVLRFRNSLEMESRLPPGSVQKGTPNNLGIAMLLDGSGDEAAEFYETRLRRLGGLLGPEGEIGMLNAGAFVLLRLGRYDSAVSWLKKAMLLAEESGALHALSSIMGNLITSLLKESRYAESLPLLQKMLGFQQRLGSNRDVAYSFLRQGSIYLTLGMAESAKSCLEKGRHFLQQAEDPPLSVWYSLIEGYWEREHGDPMRAETLVRHAEETARQMGNGEIASWALYAQADMAYDRRDFPTCRRCLESLGPSVEDKEFLARLHLLQAKLVARTSHENEETLFARVETECMEGHFREILGELYHDWALSRREREGPEAARALLRQGIQIVEAIADSLPEEYKGRYLNLPRRRQLFEDWKTLQAAEKPGWSSRLKEFLHSTRQRFVRPGIRRG